MDTIWTRPKIEHGKMTQYGWMVLYPEHLHLSEFTDIGAFTLIQAEYGVEIGEHAQIGAHTVVYSMDSEGCRKGKVVIGKYARIGSHCSIMPGVEIGPYAVIGAHSFVNTNIPAYALAYGVPARVIKERYGNRPYGKECSGDRWTRTSWICDIAENGRSRRVCNKGRSVERRRLGS